MKAFLAAVVVAVLLAIGAAFALDFVDEGAELVDFMHGETERFVASWRPTPHGEVALGERSNEVAERLQGSHHPLADREREAQPKRPDDNGEGPLDLGREVTEPEK